MTAVSWGGTCLAVTTSAAGSTAAARPTNRSRSDSVHVTPADLAPCKQTRDDDDLFNVAPEVTCTGASRSRILCISATYAQFGRVLTCAPFAHRAQTCARRRRKRSSGCPETDENRMSRNIDTDVCVCVTGQAGDGPRWFARVPGEVASVQQQ